MQQHEMQTEPLYRLFLKFVLPAILSMVLAGIQGMIDGIFLGKYASTNAMAGVNIAIPYMQTIIGCTMIICTGSISFVGRTLGEQKKESVSKAQNIFRSSVIALLFAAFMIMFLGIFLNQTLATYMGANAVLLKDTADYIRTLSFFSPMICFMLFFGFMARLLGKPHLYLVATVTCLVSNIVTDFVAIKILQLGTTGAALATGIAYTAGLMITIRPFLKKSNILNIYQGKFQFKLLQHTVCNGSSEGVTSLSTAVTVWLFNMALMQYAGEQGVAAFTVINYISNFVILVMFGVADGSGILLSYNYGAGNHERVRNILRISLLLNFISGVLIFLIFNLCTESLIGIFLTDTPEILQLSTQGAHIYSIAFLFNGFTIMQSGYQTALGNAVNSLLIAGSRGLIFIVIGMMILPKFFELQGVWLTMPFAEFSTILVCMVLYFMTSRKQLLRQAHTIQ